MLRKKAIMYQLIWNGKELTQRYFGKSSITEVRQSIYELQGDYRFDEVTDSYLDFTDCQEFITQEGVIDEIAALDSAAAISNPKIRIAVITDNTDVIEAARAYLSTGMGGYPLTIFSSIADARSWFSSRRGR